MRMAAGRCFAPDAPDGRMITLCIGITCGWPGSSPSSWRIGVSVRPNLSNAACDVHTSNTISLSLGPKLA